MKNLLYILCFVLSFQMMAQTKQVQPNPTQKPPKTAVKKPVHTTVKTAPSVKPKPKHKSQPAVEFTKTALTPEQQVTLTKMAYDIYKIQMDVKPSLLDNQMTMGDVVMPNSLTVTSEEIIAAVEQMKKGFGVKVQKATSFVTVAGVPQNNAYWATVTADCKMLPYFRYVDFDSKWSSVKTKQGMEIMTMNEKDQLKENKLAANTNTFSYNLIIDYKPGDSIPNHVTGELKVAVPKKFEVLELKKIDLNKERVLGKTKIKLVKLFARNYAIQVQGDDPSLKMMVISDENKQFISNNIAHISMQQYAAFSQPGVQTDETLDKLGATVNDINEVNRVKIGKVKGKGNIVKIVLFRAIDVENVNIKLDLTKIEVKE